MKDKEPYKKANPEKWKEAKKKKRAEKQLKEDRQRSRDRRNYIRNAIASFCESFRCREDSHLVLVVSETANMEQVLLQPHKIDEKNIFLTLPILNQEMLENYFIETGKNLNDKKAIMVDSEQTLKDVIEYYFKVKVSDINNLFESSIITCNVQELSLNTNLIPTIVRVYDYNLWCNGDFATALGKNIYNDNRLKEMIVPMNNQLNNKSIFAHQDLITQLLLHKSCKGKIRFPESLLQEINVFSRRDGLDRELFRLTSIFRGTNTFYPDLSEVKDTLESYGRGFDDKGFSWDEYCKTERAIAVERQRAIEKSEIVNLDLPFQSQLLIDSGLKRKLIKSIKNNE